MNQSHSSFSPCAPEKHGAAGDARRFSDDPDTERLCNALARAPLFNGLSCAEIARFARGVREQQLEKGCVLFHKGDTCNGFYLIISGQIKLALASANGHDRVIEILRAGQSFGEAVMFMDMPYVVMAQALTDCKLLHISKSVVFEEIDHDPAFSRKIIAGLAQRLHHMIADVETYYLRSGRERVIGFLLREDDEEHGSSRKSGPVTISLPTNKGTIASRLNLTQEHFSRILHELTEASLIRVEGRIIHILDIGQLRASLT